jgi:hypothetical protein
MTNPSTRFTNRIGRYAFVETTRFKDYTYGQRSMQEEQVKEPHGSYGALLFDKRWKEKREQILRRDNRMCVICGSTGDLQIHHRQYHFMKEIQKFKAPWDYEDHLMIALCERCHSKGHSKYKVPTIYL